MNKLMGILALLAVAIILLGAGTSMLSYLKVQKIGFAQNDQSADTVTMTWGDGGMTVAGTLIAASGSVGYAATANNVAASGITAGTVGAIAITVGNGGSLAPAGTGQVTANNLTAGTYGVSITGTAGALSQSATISWNPQTGSYGLQASDAGYAIAMSVSGTVATTVTIPLSTGGGGVNYQIGTQISIVQEGVAPIVVIGASGVTVWSTGAVPTQPQSRAQFSPMYAIKRSSDSWYVWGDIR